MTIKIENIIAIASFIVIPLLSMVFYPSLEADYSSSVLSLSAVRKILRFPRSSALR